MKINGTNNGAAAYAMKKAMEMPNATMNVVQNSGASKEPTQTTQNPVAQPVDRATVTGKGKLIDLVG